MGVTEKADAAINRALRGERMAEKFQLFRLSLLPHEQGRLFVHGSLDREQWLRAVFSQQHHFSTYGSKFHFIPVGEPTDKILVGKMGRGRWREENTPPEEGLREVVTEVWRAALIVIDPTHHDDGQKMAIQILTDVGAPSALINGLARSINETMDDSPFYLEASPIPETSSFWKFVEENDGHITSVTFEFITPNMFGGADQITDELRAYRDNERAHRAQLTLKNETGLSLRTQRAHLAVDYVQRGGGSVRARAKGGRTYNSNRTIRQTRVEALVERGVELASKAREIADIILGR